MTSPDPEDGTRPDSPELPADVDAAFAAIVAGWKAADDAPRWPHDPTEDDGPSSGVGTMTPPQGQRAPGPPPTAPRRTPPATGAPPPGPRDYVPPTDPADEHFVPPEPPPMPRLGLSSLLGLALLVVGVVLLAVPGVFGGPVALGIVPGLLAMTAGLGWLVFGLRRARESGEGTDDGAVL